MQRHPGDGLDRALQGRQGELGRHQFEHHRAVLDLAPDARQASGQDAAVIRDHRLAQGGRQGGGLGRILALGPGPVAGGLGGQARLVEQLVALQHPFLVPRRAVQGEGQPGAGPLAGVLAGPAAQGRGDGLVQQGRATVAPVLPGEEGRPRGPGGVGDLGLDGRGGQAQIADRERRGPRRPPSRRAGRRGPRRRRCRAAPRSPAGTGSAG